MPYDPNRHHRRSIRLRGYDYTQAGAYYVTIVTQDRAALFGDVVEGVMQLNDAGRMVEQEWSALAVRFPSIELDAVIIMPNHIHGIVVIGDPATTGAGLVPAQIPTPTPPPQDSTVDPTDHPVQDEEEGAGTRPAPTALVALGDVMGAFKSITTHAYIQGVRHDGWPAFNGRVWQRNYYEHIIRDDPSLERIRQYIEANPERWAADRENPDAADQRKRQ